MHCCTRHPQSPEEIRPCAEPASHQREAGALLPLVGCSEGIHGGRSRRDDRRIKENIVDSQEMNKSDSVVSAYPFIYTSFLHNNSPIPFVVFVKDRGIAHLKYWEQERVNGCSFLLGGIL